MKPVLLALPLLAAAALSLVLTPLAKWLARRMGAMDLPNVRKVHKVPVPRLGGVAVIAAFALVCAAMLAGILPVSRPPQAEFLQTLALGLLPVFTVSLLDDIRPQRAFVRLAAQTAGAAFVVANGFVLNPSIHLFGAEIEIGLLAAPLSLLWILGVTNAFNLIDGLDGLSAGLALISAFSLVGVFLLADRIEVAVIPLALAGALLGFLRYNLYPASIFLGDSGACSIGFVLACLCLKGNVLLSAGLAVLIPVLIVGVPIADTVLSIVRRVINRIEDPTTTGVMEADRGHIHHRLLGLGLNQRRAVFLLHGVALACALLALGSLFLSERSAAMFLVALLGAAFIGISRLGYDELAFVRRGTVLRIYDIPALKTGFFIVFADLLMAVTAVYLAIGLKWDDWDLKIHRDLAREMGAVVPILVVLTFFLFGLYRRRWRHATLEDLARPSGAVLMTGAGAMFVDVFAFDGRTPASYFVVFTTLLLFFANGSRSSYRLLAWMKARSAEAGVRVLLYGAGRRGSMAIRELQGLRNIPLFPVGFVDDDLEKQGRFLNGLPVLGTLDDLDALIEKHGVGGVIVTTPRIPRASVLRVEDVCVESHAAFLQFNVSFDGTLIARRDDEAAPAAEKPMEDEVGVSEEATR
jgi:UDP-GlcNAc:undecaprenyl-phosphate GlcNAc-1-phosphate transferase